MRKLLLLGAALTALSTPAFATDFYGDVTGGLITEATAGDLEIGDGYFVQAGIGFAVTDRLGTDVTISREAASINLGGAEADATLDTVALNLEYAATEHVTLRGGVGFSNVEVGFAPVTFEDKSNLTYIAGARYNTYGPWSFGGEWRRTVDVFGKDVDRFLFPVSFRY